MKTLNKNLLRFITAGSVDDGKSTLIGRLLFDTKSIFEDQINAVKKTSARKGEHEVDLSMFTDGLKDEVELGITIDVAYRYFTTPKRKFIIADSPGHFEFTRNMVTAASTANAAVILIDAKNGITEQTKRHSYLANLLGIEHIIVCINKMDLLNWKKERFNELVDEYKSMANALKLTNIAFIPMSALKGDNIVTPSNNMHWYTGKTLLEQLEVLPITAKEKDLRLPIQAVIKNNNTTQLLGQLESDSINLKDTYKVLPEGHSFKLSNIFKGYEAVEIAEAGYALQLETTSSIAFKRGQIIVPSNSEVELLTELTANICWFDIELGIKNKPYLLQQHATTTEAIIGEIINEVDITNFQDKVSTGELGTNAIAKVKIITKTPLINDKYENSNVTGSFILIDELNNKTVAAGIIC